MQVPLPLLTWGAFAKMVDGVMVPSGILASVPIQAAGCPRGPVGLSEPRLTQPWHTDSPVSSRPNCGGRRLERLLNEFCADDHVIVPEECRSLICEIRGDLPGAIKHRENEIRLIKRLHRISQNTPSHNFALSQYDYSDLSDRLDLLATVYYEAGKPKRATRTLEESKKLCATRGIKFAGQELMREYLYEAGSKASRSRA
jgi:hypothetical protein